MPLALLQVIESFNEARAMNSGKPMRYASAGMDPRRFNEARAMNSGKPP